MAQQSQTGPTSILASGREDEGEEPAFPWLLNAGDEPWLPMDLPRATGTAGWTDPGLMDKPAPSQHISFRRVIRS